MNLAAAAFAQCHTNCIIGIQAQSCQCMIQTTCPDTCAQKQQCDRQPLRPHGEVLIHLSRGTRPLQLCTGSSLFSDCLHTMRLTPRMYIHVKTICGVNGSSCGHAYFLARSELHIKFVEDNSHSNDCLHESELVTYTFPWTSAEWNVPTETPCLLSDLRYTVLHAHICSHQKLALGHT